MHDEECGFSWRMMKRDGRDGEYRIASSGTADFEGGAGGAEAGGNPPE